MKENNPFIQPYNHWAGYQDSINKLKDKDPESLDFEKLCYRIFDTEDGKRLMNIIEQNYLLPVLIQRGCENYETWCVWANGFKEAFLTLRNSAKNHLNRSNKMEGKL